MYTKSLQDLEPVMNAVRGEMLRRFPNASHTVTFRLWDDNTESVECKHGEDGYINVVKFYDGVFFYEKFAMFTNIGYDDETGKEYFILSGDELLNHGADVKYEELPNLLN